MAEYLTTDTDLQSVADAIRAKSGTSEPLEYPDGFVSAIEDIETEWAGNRDQPPEITDGKMHVWVDIPSGMKGEWLNMPLRWTQTVSNGVEVDWGDGTTPVTYAGTGAANHFHQYAKGGRYEIKIALLDGEINFNDSTATAAGWNGIYGSADNIGNYWIYRIVGIYCPFEITAIAESFFRVMPSLRFLVFPNAKLTQISNSMLRSSANVLTLDLGEDHGTITRIGEYAFSYLDSMSSISIPSSVDYIGQYAFRSNYIPEYHFKSTTPPTLASTNVFTSIRPNCVIYVPRGCLNAYKTATNWSAYASNIQEEPE